MFDLACKNNIPLTHGEHLSDFGDTSPDNEDPTVPNAATANEPSAGPSAENVTVTPSSPADAVVARLFQELKHARETLAKSKLWRDSMGLGDFGPSIGPTSPAGEDADMSYEERLAQEIQLSTQWLKEYKKRRERELRVRFASASLARAHKGLVAALTARNKDQVERLMYVRYPLSCLCYELTTSL